MAPSLLLGDFKYSSDNYYCQNEYTNLRSTFVNGVIAYSISMSITIGSYFYTLRKMSGGNNNLVSKMTQIQQISARRDLIILFRICILVRVLMTVSIPPMIIHVLLIYLFTGYVPWWSTQFQWFLLSLSTTTASVVLALISPHVRNLWTEHFNRHHHHHRNAIMPVIVRNN